MAEDDPDRDEEWFKEVYGKEYTGPLSRVRQEDSGRTGAAAKRPAEDSDEDEGPRDPNAVPTDFTSREAKVWEAKAKAIERNWKRRKEEELHCKICGEQGHFAQGCPTTLGGGNRKPGEVVERVPLKDKRIKPRLIGTGGSVIQGIEKDTGCRLKLEDNHGGGVYYVRISGPDRVTVSKAVNAVKKLAEQFEDEYVNKNTSTAQQNARRHTKGSPLVSAQMDHMQRVQQTINGGGQMRAEDERIAYQMEPKRDWGTIQVVNGTGRTVKFRRDEYFRGRSQDNGSYSTSRRQGYEDMKAAQPFPHETLEELEQSFLQEAVELSNEQSVEEDRELSRHRQCLREIQEQYQQKMMNLRTKQSRQRDEFLHQEAQFRQQYYQQQTGYLYEGSHAYTYGYEYPTPHHRKQGTDSNSSVSYGAAYGRNSPAYQRHL